MPTLTELKNKWFIDVTATTNKPPTTRYTGSTISPSTDGNKVEFIRDGQNYMKQWHDSIQAMISSASPVSCDVWHCGWRFEDVRTLGYLDPDPTSDALLLLKKAHTSGVKLLGMLSGHMAGAQFNTKTRLWMVQNGINTMPEDLRFPLFGSAHQKFTCMRDPNNPKAMLGSIDISKTRWDTVEHLSIDPNRDPKYGKQTHDTGVIIRGPAVGDMEAAFKDRWNDSSRTWKSLPLITAPVSAPGPVSGGTQSVQVLTIFGIPRTNLDGHSWAAVGDFTIWASYLNAIKQAKTYIYIEDQYFLPFGWPPCYKGTGTSQTTDLTYQLGQAINRGVKVLVLVPRNAEDPLHEVIKYQRDMGIAYLKDIASKATGGGDFVVGSLWNGQDIYVHSKLMMVDDEFMIIGSANVGQRSMTQDGELDVGIVDSANTFVKASRKELWLEHLGASHASEVEDPVDGYAAMKQGIESGTGHLKSYEPMDPDTKPKFYHSAAVRVIIDPYAGPNGYR